MPEPRRILRVVVVLVALIVAGCGGDTEEKNAYVDQVNQAQQRLATAAARANAITETSSKRSDIRTLNTYRAAISRIVADLRKITPPEEVKAEHQQLIDAQRPFGASIDALIKAVEGGSPAAILKAKNATDAASQDTGTKTNTVREKINAKLAG